MTPPHSPRSATAPRWPGWIFGIFAIWALAGFWCASGHGVACVACLLAPAPWFVYELLPSGSRAFGRGARSFTTSGREVWLTIDDGPDPRTTVPLLALLKARGCRATFFLIGERARAHPELVDRILAEGHEVANHTVSHPAASFWWASVGRLRAEISEFPCATRWFRPPAGIKNPWLAPFLRRSGLTLVLWSARGLDGLDRPAAKSFARIAPGLKPGAIVLVHEVPAAPERTLDFIGRVTAELAARQLVCVIPAPERLRERLA